MDEVDPDRVHPDFERILCDRPPLLQFLYRDIRRAILRLYPDSNELLYHTQALSSAYSVSRQLKHAFCHIAVYRNHINLGFNAGAELDDPDRLLQGKGARIRHIPIREPADLERPQLIALIKQAIDYSIKQLNKEPTERNVLISKIKT